MVRPAIFLVIFVILLGRCYTQHLLVLWQMLLPFVFYVVFSIRCYWLMISGDVTTIEDYWLMLLPCGDVIATFYTVWLMLLPKMWLMLLPLLLYLACCCWRHCCANGWCYCHCVFYLADVIANGWCYCQVADVIATFEHYVRWLMLLPGGWCYFHIWALCWVADVITTLGVVGTCYSQVADGIATGQCLSFNSDVLCKTSSHMWGRWSLPIFLFRDGSLTLISIASLIALMRFWSSLPTVVNLLILIWWPEVLQWSNIGEGAFDVLWTFQQRFCQILLYILLHTLVLCIDICIWLHSCCS